MVDATAEGLPVSVIIEHVLPLLDRVSWNRLCSTFEELYANSRKVHTPWPFKRRLYAGGRGNVYSVPFLPDNELLASGGRDDIIRIWNRTEGLCTQLEEGPGVRDLCFSPDGKLLASTDQDTTIRLWKLEDWSFRVLEVNVDFEVLSIAFSSDSSTLVSGDEGGKICLWDVNDGRCIREWWFVRQLVIFFRLRSLQTERQ